MEPLHHKKAPPIPKVNQLIVVHLDYKFGHHNNIFYYFGLRSNSSISQSYINYIITIMFTNSLQHENVQ